MDEQPNVKEFPGNPSVFVTSKGSVIGVTHVECPFETCDWNENGKCSRIVIRLTKLYLLKAPDEVGEYYLDCQDFRRKEVKEFPGNPSVFVASKRSVIGVTTSEHLKNEGKRLEQILKEVCEAARQYANKIFHEYDYPDGKWYPCGSADIVLRWNQHRDIIKLFQKTATEKKTDYWTGWFGKLHKTETLGWWWLPKLDQGSQSMLYEEEVCRFVRQKLAFANIVVEIRTYID